jgi:hypothetical protein
MHKNCKPIKWGFTSRCGEASDARPTVAAASARSPPWKERKKHGQNNRRRNQ